MFLKVEFAVNPAAATVFRVQSMFGGWWLMGGSTAVKGLDCVSFLFPPPGAARDQHYRVYLTGRKQNGLFSLHVKHMKQIFCLGDVVFFLRVSVRIQATASGLLHTLYSAPSPPSAHSRGSELNASSLHTITVIARPHRGRRAEAGGPRAPAL